MPIREKQGRATRQLQRRFVAVLEEVRREYDRGHLRWCGGRTPIEEHVRAILTLYRRAKRFRQGKPTSSDGLLDLMLPSLQRPGPLGLTAARTTLEGWRVSRRDIAWLLREAKMPVSVRAHR